MSHSHAFATFYSCENLMSPVEPMYTSVAYCMYVVFARSYFALTMCAHWHNSVTKVDFTLIYLIYTQGWDANILHFQLCHWAPYTLWLIHTSRRFKTTLTFIKKCVHVSTWWIKSNSLPFSSTNTWWEYLAFYFQSNGFCLLFGAKHCPIVSHCNYKNMFIKIHLSTWLRVNHKHSILNENALLLFCFFVYCFIW